MAEGNSGVGSFITKHRTAIIATIAAGSAAAGAFYYYNQLANESSEKETKSSKKKHKKKKGKTKKSSSSNASTADEKESSEESKPKYPIKENGEPDLGNIEQLSKEDRDKYAMALKDKGNHYFKKKDFENALKYYDYALEFKKDPVFYSNISACYVSLNQLDKVVENSTKALELKPDYSKALLRRASAYENLENYSEAIFDLSVLSLNNDFSGASIEPMLERNLNKQAMKVLKEKLDNEKEGGFEQQLPSDTSMASFFGIFTPEVSFDNYDDSNEADKELLNGLKNLYSAKHGCYTVADKSFSKAASLLTEQHNETSSDNKLKQKLAIALEYVGIFKFLKNDLPGAQLDIQEAISLNPRPTSYIYMALTMADKGDNQEYINYFEKAIALDPKCSATYYHRGQLHFITQEYEKAKEDFLKAKELDAKNIFSYIQLACLAYREGKMDECSQQFEETKKLFPVAPEVPTFYAEILADKGDLETASKQYDFAKRLEENQDCIHVGVAPLVGKATVLARQATPENFADATKLLEEACEKDPRSEQAKVGLAQLKLQQEDVETAIKLFEDAADLARSTDEKLQATTFAEAAKIQKKIRADPVIRAKVDQALADYRAQGMI